MYFILYIILKMILIKIKVIIYNLKCEYFKYVLKY